MSTRYMDQVWISHFQCLTLISTCSEGIEVEPVSQTKEYFSFHSERRASNECKGVSICRFYECQRCFILHWSWLTSTEGAGKESRSRREIITWGRWGHLTDSSHLSSSDIPKDAVPMASFVLTRSAFSLKSCLGIICVDRIQRKAYSIINSMVIVWIVCNVYSKRNITRS